MNLWRSTRKWPIFILAVLALTALHFQISPVRLCSPTKQGVALRLRSKAPTTETRIDVAREELPIEVLEHGLQGRIHQEPAYATWNECIILVGGVNYTRAQGAAVLRTGPVTQFAKEGSWGSRKVTIFNMKNRTVRSGPDTPIINNHAMGAMSPDGRMYALMSQFYLLRSENASENGVLHHYVWDFAGGGTSWEKRASLSNITGAGRCEFVHNLMYCFGGSLGAGMATVDTLNIYNPRTDTWTRGASMPEELDHSASVVYDNRIWSTSGRYHVNHKPGTAEAFPKAPSSAASLVYDPSRDSWARVEPLPYRRNAAVATVVRRPGRKATLLAAGGQIFAGIRAGIIFSMLEEYDFEEEDWFCHATHLPQGVFGAAVGVFDNKVYIVGGADGYHISGTDSVMIIDINALGEPMPCLYDETSRPDWWTDYRAGNMANYPYAKHLLSDKPAPLTSV